MGDRDDGAGGDPMVIEPVELSLASLQDPAHAGSMIREGASASLLPIERILREHGQLDRA